LPKTVASARDGWQWTSQSGAVVSGLLSAVASQLLTAFKDKNTPLREGQRNFIVGACYLAIFCNINATIGSFVLIDNLGEVGFEAAKREAENQLDDISRAGNYHGSITGLLKKFGATSVWTVMLLHWLLTFYLGILSLIVSLLAYAVLTEPRATQIVLSIGVGITLIPTTVFIFRGVFNGLWHWAHDSLQK